MRILSVKAENILSIDKLDFAIEDSGLVLIEGWNFDDDRATGAGKTAIFNIISFALYGKIPRKITSSEILRRGMSSGYAEVVVAIKDDVYKITRGRPKALCFEKNNTPITMTQEAFEEVIQLSYDQFLIAMYTSQGNGERFLSLNDTSKKDFILKLMNLEHFLAGKKSADKVVQELEQKLANDQLQIEKAKAKIEVYAGLIEDVDPIVEELDQQKLAVKSLNTELKTFDNVARPDVSKYEKLESEIAKKLADLNTIRYKRSQELAKYNELDKLICEFTPPKSNATCPHCKGLLVAHNSEIAAVGDLETLRSQHDDEIDATRMAQSAVEQSIDAYDDELCREQSIKDLLIKTREAKSKEYRNYDITQERMRALQDTIAKDENQIRTLSNKLLTIQNAQENAAVLQEYIAQINQKVESYQNDINLYKAASLICSTTGIPAYIMDSAVDLFNEKITNYINHIWPIASYQLNTYRENKSGDVTSKFSESLTIDGVPCSIGSLSGGEFRAFSLAVDFALIDVLTEQFGLSINPIMMDEPFEGLDAKGREVVINLLIKLSADRQILVVDHANEAKTMFSKIIKVEKRSGISSILI